MAETKGDLLLRLLGNPFSTASETFDAGLDTWLPASDYYSEKAPCAFGGPLTRLHFKDR